MTTFAIASQAIRPKTLVASFCPVAIGSVLAYKSGSFDLLLCLFTFFCALLIQITANLVNDLYDFLKGADTKERKGPLRVTQAGLISVGSMRRAVLFSFLLSFALGLFLIFKGGLVIGALLALSLLLAYLYTAGPFPLAYLGLGELFVFIFFGPVATAGVFFLQKQIFSLEALTVGVPCGLLSTAILLVNNLRDEEEDKRAHKKTLVVRWGSVFGKGLYLFCIFFSIFLSFFLPARAYLASFSALFAIPLAINVLRCREHLAMNAYLPKTALLLLIHTLLLTIGLMA